MLHKKRRDTITYMCTKFFFNPKAIFLNSFTEIFSNWMSFGSGNRLILLEGLTSMLLELGPTRDCTSVRGLPLFALAASRRAVEEFSDFNERKVPKFKLEEGLNLGGDILAELWIKPAIVNHLIITMCLPRPYSPLIKFSMCSSSVMS